MPTALILDDDDAHADALAAQVASHGFDVLRYDSLAAAREVAEDTELTLAFVTLHCRDGEGLDLLEHPALARGTEIILMNATDEPALVNRGIDGGATYFFCKPFDADFVGTILSDLKSEAGGGAGNDAAAPPVDQFGLLRGGSTVMRKLYRIMRRVAPTLTSVLLVGESGTGKELVARTLHLLSHRADGPFVAMNCAAIPKELFESELFGHEKGAFSGAHRRHLGYFERAHGGTLFLDEITEMPPELQVKLLRVLELGQYRRVGGEEDLTSDARIIAATNRDLEEAVTEGLLREDLYYRIARFPLVLPPLRDREEDVRGLAQFFLNELNARNETQVGLTEAAMERIESHSWPGNVRELSGVIERAYILADDEIGTEHLKDLDTEGASADYIRVPATASVDEAERKLVYAALDKYEGDKQAAARSLGISLKTLYNRLNQYADQEREDS